MRQTHIRAKTASQLFSGSAELREASGLSQEESAERIERDGRHRQRTLKVRSGSDIYAIERDQEDPSFLTLVDIASAIHMPLIFTGSDRLRARNEIRMRSSRSCWRGAPHNRYALSDADRRKLPEGSS